jgi:phosphoribosylamine--glycine ligase
MRLKSDLLALLDHAIDGTLDQIDAQWDRRPALGVVVAAHGYPEQPRKGDIIGALPADTDDCRVFHAGTAREGASLLTSGGRVLCVTALGENLRAARRQAYASLAQVQLAGAQFRNDIGNRALPGGV